jgi:hypothetical protein
MSNKLAKIALIAGSVLLSQLQWVQAGPFGLSEGMTPAEARANETGWIADVPRPDSDFTAYNASFSKKSGLCRVSAGTRDFNDDKSGERVREAFSVLREKMDGLYGSSTLIDESLDASATGANWSEEILKSHRRYIARWKPSDPKSELSAASLVAIASSPTTTRMFVFYSFKNFLDCAAEQEAGGL